MSSPLFTDISPKEVVTPEAITPEQSPQDKKLAETFQRIAKQESHVKAERAKIDEARKAFETEKAKADKYSSLEGKNPFDILEHFGISYDKLLEADKERRNPMDPNVRKALQEVEALKSQLSTKDEEATQERRSKAELQIKAEIARTIKDNEFDVIEVMGAESAVMEYMEEIYSQTQEIPDYKEACQAVADSIVEQYHKLSKSKWVQPKAEVKEQSIQKSIPDSKSLSNKMTQSAVANDKPLTEAQRFQAALNALKAQK